MPTRSGLTTDELAGRTDDPVDRQDSHPAPRPPAAELDGAREPDPTDEPRHDGAPSDARRDATAGHAVRTTHLGTAPASSPRSVDDELSLLDDATAAPFAERWRDVQTRFVDDPRAAVRDADGLVAELMQTLAERFAAHKSGLEEQWNRGAEPGTEQLRLAMQQYRSFFDRLLAA